MFVFMYYANGQWWQHSHCPDNRVTVYHGDVSANEWMHVGSECDIELSAPLKVDLVISTPHFITVNVPHQNDIGNVETITFIFRGVRMSLHRNRSLCERTWHCCDIEHCHSICAKLNKPSDWQSKKPSRSSSGASPPFDRWFVQRKFSHFAYGKHTSDSESVYFQFENIDQENGIW